MMNHHDLEFWATKRRTLTPHTVKECKDLGDSYQFVTTERTGFVRLKADVGAALQPGDRFELETVNWSTISGMRVAGVWRFRMTNEDLANEAQERSKKYEDQLTVHLEANMKKYWQWEQELPDWLRARINRFRDAAGEKFLREGWGYELVIARLAVAYTVDDQELISKLDTEMGCSGNQHAFAAALADMHNAGRDEEIAKVSIAGLAPLTGSADYS